MKLEVCDLCGNPIKPHEKITLGFGAIRQITGALRKEEHIDREGV